jgi:hypothetical protein
VILAGFILVQVSGPQPINWKPSFSRTHKYPFGGMILHDMLPDLFPGRNINQVDKPAYEFLEDFEGEGVNYIIIDDVFETDQYEAKHLMEFVEEGNNVFIAANMFTGSFADTFLLETSQGSLFGLVEYNEVNLKTGIDTLDRVFSVKKGVKHYSFSKYPRSFDTEELGTCGEYNPNFVRLGYGKGNFYLHSGPMLFSNYNMLWAHNYEYVASALSFLPQGDIYWDEYYKPTRSRTGSPFKYILQSQGLRWAWLIALPALLLFVFFEGKRRQRIIPVITPPRNDSLEFTETIGRLYYEHGDHHDIALKKVRYLLEYIRTRFYMETKTRDAQFVKRLAQKSGVPEAEVGALMNYITQLEQMQGLSEASLLQLNLMIDDFYTKSK